MTREGLPLIADEVGRSTEQPEIPTPQSLGGGMCSLIFNNISDDVFGKVFLYDHHISNNRFLSKKNSFFDGREIHVQ